jgi:DNA repair protein RadC
MSKYEVRTPVKQWAEDDRPREKLLLKGRQSMSDTELLAILIGSGTRSESALDLAKIIFRKAHDNLVELSKMTLQELVAVKGIGKVKAVTIIAALELGRRRDESQVMVREKITNSREAYQILKSVMGDRPYEEFWIILLNKANKVLNKYSISEGGISGTTVDPRKIYKIALDHHASSIILGHNHPSGNLTPSENDTRITGKIAEAGRLLDIAVLDHIILGENDFYSFSDSGKL